jgi:hypothetical protein
MGDRVTVKARGADAQGHPDQGQECASQVADLRRMLTRLAGATSGLDQRVRYTTDHAPTGSDPHRSPMSAPRQDRAGIGANLTLARRYLLAALDAAGETWTETQNDGSPLR